MSRPFRIGLVALALLAAVLPAMSFQFQADSVGGASRKLMDAQDVCYQPLYSPPFDCKTISGNTCKSNMDHSYDSLEICCQGEFATQPKEQVKCALGQAPGSCWQIVGSACVQKSGAECGKQFSYRYVQNCKLVLSWKGIKDEEDHYMGHDHNIPHHDTSYTQRDNSYVRYDGGFVRDNGNTHGGQVAASGWKPGDSFRNYVLDRYAGCGPAGGGFCCKVQDYNGEDMLCYYLNDYYSQCLRKSDCTPPFDCSDWNGQCGGPRDPNTNKVRNEWEDCGGKVGCCKETNSKGEKLYCFAKDPYFSQCRTQMACKAENWPACEDYNSKC